jgi:site-specific DNA recombinase
MDVDVTSTRRAPIRAAIYGRYSSHMQRKASLEDQFFNCREAAERKGLRVLEEFVRGDKATPGKKFTTRESLQYLLTEAKTQARPFDYLIVDEISRLGRVQEKVLQVVRRFKQAGVKVYFVFQNLDSSDPHFSFALSILAAQDEASNEKRAYRVKRGHEGARNRGNSAGGFCYGYRTEGVLESGVLRAQSHGDYSGFRWVIYEPEAVMVRRIFTLFADGMSTWSISALLTAEGIASPQVRHRPSKETKWTPTGVMQLLQRERYNGELVWNKTNTWFDHDEEKTRITRNPRELWRRKLIPELRIVSEELWQRAQNRQKVVSEKFKSYRVGGLARAKKGQYPFSGLLYCGVCGGRLAILSGGVGRYPSYGCISARYGRGCTNHLWIRENRLTEQLLSMLVKNLLVPEVMDAFVLCVSQELERFLKGSSSNHVDALSERKTLEALKVAEIQRLMTVILRPESEGSEVLPEMLRVKEAELKQVRSDIALLSVPSTATDTKLDLRGMLEENVEYLREILMQDFSKTRAVLQRMIHKLHLAPIATEKGEAYFVMGEIELFTPLSGKDKRVLLERSSTRTLQQYTPHVDFLFRFAGEIAYTNYEVTLPPGPIFESLQRLLRSRPELLNRTGTSKFWFGHFASTEGHSDAPFTINKVAQYFAKHGNLLRQNFGMKRNFAKHPQIFEYSFSCSGEESASVSSEALRVSTTTELKADHDRNVVPL